MAVAGGSRRPAAQVSPALGAQVCVQVRLCGAGVLTGAWPSTSLCVARDTGPGGGQTWEGQPLGLQAHPKPPKSDYGHPVGPRLPFLIGWYLAPASGPSYWWGTPSGPAWALLQAPVPDPQSVPPGNPCCRPPSAPEIPGAGAAPAPLSSKGISRADTWVLRDPTDWPLSKHSCKHRCVALR